MTWHIPPITVVVPQLDRWSIGDKISAVAVFVTFMAFLVSYFATYMSNVTNRRNYMEARLQREQSIIESQRTYELMVVQMNRDNRIRLYAPLLAWLSGRLQLFNEEVRLLFPALHGVERPLTTLERDFEALQSRVVSFEFSTQLDLLGTEAIQNEVRTWKNDCHVAENMLKALKDYVRPSDEEERAIFDRNFLATKESLIEHGANLTRNLDNIRQLIMREIDLPLSVSDEDIGGTTGAQENGNE